MNEAEKRVLLSSLILPPSSFALWLLVCVLAASATTLVAVHLPPAVKLLGLFAIVYGVVVGWIAARAWGIVGGGTTPPLPVRAAIVFLIVLGGEIGIALEAHRIQQNDYRERLAADSKRAIALGAIESARSSADPAVRRQADEMGQTIDAGAPTFADYLRRRTSDLGPLGRRAGPAIWVLEIVLGSLAGAGFFFRQTRHWNRLEGEPSAAKLEE